MLIIIARHIINNESQMSKIESSAQFPPALRALLTSKSIIKIGLGVKKSLLEIANSFDDAELWESLRSPAIVELAHHAKLKGCIKNLSAPLDALAGIILKKFVTLPPHTAPSNWTAEYIQQL
jgi:hypothetical protein